MGNVMNLDGAQTGRRARPANSHHPGRAEVRNTTGRALGRNGLRAPTLVGEVGTRKPINDKCSGCRAGVPQRWSWTSQDPKYDEKEQ